MNRRTLLRIAFGLIGMLLFAQFNAAMANCAMGGDSMMSRGMSDTPCDGCDTPLNKPQDQVSSVCATHCATGEQPSAVSATTTVATIQQPVLVVPRLVPRTRPTGLDGPPSGSPPRRILLHSFLI